MLLYLLLLPCLSSSLKDFLEEQGREEVAPGGSVFLQHFLEEPGREVVTPGGNVLLPCRVGARGGECRWERDGVQGGLYLYYS